MQVKSPIVAFLVMLLDEIPIGVLEEHAKSVYDHAQQGGRVYEFESELQVATANCIAQYLARAEQEIKCVS